MNTTQPLNKILFLLDEISQCKQRLSIASDVTRDIEIALLQSKTIALYAEIQQYNRETLQVPATQTYINNYQAAPIKEVPESKNEPISAGKEPWPFETPVPKQETVNSPKPEVVAEKPQPPADAPKLEMETTQTSDKQPKPIHPRSAPIYTETSSITEDQEKPQKKDITDFEKKREKLLREEQEESAAQQQVENKVPAENSIKQTPKPEIIQEKPVNNTPQPVVEQTRQAEKVVEEQKTTPQPEPEIQKPETAKPNVSQLYAQARERATIGTGTEKSLNEKLATQQTSLNDKFQSNVKKNLADKLKLSPINDLRTAININQRVAFINKLFKGDDKEFKNVVSTVNGFKNFSEAKFYLQSDVATRYSWNEQDENVQEFMELVYRKFL